MAIDTPKSEWNDTFLSAIHLLQYRQVKSLFWSQISDCTKKSKKMYLAKNTQWKTFVYMFAYSFSNNLFKWEIGSLQYLFPFMDRVIFHDLWETWVPTCSTYPELRIQDPAERKLKLTTELNNGRLVPRLDVNCFVVQVDTCGRYNTTRNSNEQQTTRSNKKSMWVTNNQNLVDLLRQTCRSKISQVVTASQWKSVKCRKETWQGKIHNL